MPGAIGIFGGTFDPVHFGHLRAAQEARDRLALDDFRLMPAGNPPHRSLTFASGDHRLAMLELGIAGQPGFTVDAREVRRDGFSYMCDTLAEIRVEEGERPLLLMIGQDAANALDGWHRWQSLFELAHIVVMRRPDARHVYSGDLFAELVPRTVDSVTPLKQSPAGHVLHLEVTQLAISSTGIREQFANGESPRFLLPDPVIDYIRQQGLYGT